MKAWTLLFFLSFLPAPSGAWQSGTDPDLTKGIRQVDEGEFEAAIPILNTAVQHLQARGGPAAGELSRAYLYLAIAHLGLSQEQAARAKFIEAVKADKGLNLSAYEFPPKIIQAFEQAKREAAAAAAVAAGRPAKPRIPPAQLFDAVKQGDFSSVRQMVADDPKLVREQDPRFGGTPLHWAALKGNQAIVALLIAEGADLAAVNADGETPIQVAQRARKPEVEVLLRPPSGTFSASGGIFDAVKRGDLESVRQIVGKSPQVVNLKDTGFGASPLHWAALKGHDEVVRFLLTQSADTGAINNDGETPIQVADRAKRKTTVALLKGAAGSAPTQAGIIEAVRSDDIPRVKKLLAEDASRANAKDPRFGASPLHWAALRGNPEIVRLLLSRGADPRAKNRDGETALQVATRAGKTEVVAILSSR